MISPTFLKESSEFCGRGLYIQSREIQLCVSGMEKRESESRLRISRRQNLV